MAQLAAADSPELAGYWLESQSRRCNGLQPTCRRGHTQIRHSDAAEPRASDCRQRGSACIPQLCVFL